MFFPVININNDFYDFDCRIGNEVDNRSWHPRDGKGWTPNLFVIAYCQAIDEVLAMILRLVNYFFFGASEETYGSVAFDNLIWWNYTTSLWSVVCRNYRRCEL